MIFAAPADRACLAGALRCFWAACVPGLRAGWALQPYLRRVTIYTELDYCVKKPVQRGTALSVCARRACV